MWGKRGRGLGAQREDIQKLTPRRWDGEILMFFRIDPDNFLIDSQKLSNAPCLSTEW